MGEVVIRFTSEGWRGRVGEVFTEDNVSRLADGVAAAWAEQLSTAFVRVSAPDSPHKLAQSAAGASSDSFAVPDVPAQRVLIGYDTRPGAAAFAQLAGEVIASWGFEVLVSDKPCPMPALNWSLAHDEAACGGLMLTASGAPAEYLGVALRDERGLIPSHEFEELAESLIPGDPVSARGTVEYADFCTPYIAALKANFDASIIAAVHPRFVVDPMYGSGKAILADVLRDAGASVLEMHTEDSHDFAGLHPRVVEPWVDKCEQSVLAHSAHAGLVLDGDADRFGLIAPNGSLVLPQRSIALLLYYLVRAREQAGRVVMPLSGSTYIRRAAKELSCPLSVTPIGFRAAYAELEREDTLVGIGEQGGVAFPRHLLERDGIAAALLLAELIAHRDNDLVSLLSDLEQELGHFEYGARNLKIDAGQVQTLRMLLPGLNPEQLAGKAPVDVSHTDGLRLGFENGSWVLIRPSRTEAVVRLYAEGVSAQERDELLEAASTLAREEQV